MSNFSFSATSMLNRTDERKTFAQVRLESLGTSKADYFVVKGTVTLVRHETNVWYSACPTCNKKVSDADSNQVYCEKCRKNVQPTLRFLLSFSVSDHTGGAWLSAFNDVAEQLLGKTAQQLSVLKETSPQAFEEIFQAVLLKQFKFRVRAKMESYQDTPRVKLSALNAVSLDLVDEAKWLIQQIKHYQQN